MIDLHCHLLPGVDDGPATLEVSLAMARCAVADGITFTACTPHIYPGLYENNRAGIEAAVAALRTALAEAGIPLQLGTGADTHLAPDLVGGIRDGRVPTINGSRYLLLEPPHHVAPPRFDESVFTLMAAGIVPVITHPERLSWIETHYPVFADLVKQGAWMQLTAGSLTGRFGRRPKYWAERMLDEGLVHIIATDSHHIDKRPPLLAEGREAAAARVGAEEARHLVLTRPQGILDDLAPSQLPPLPERPRPPERRPGFWQRLFGTA
ncbi:CpsB/CapC family capsule biosynthesis tyrosine phosphatase [Arenimonas sp.]|uniref:tyrosine-protein phosphatase n=1 Tax=Arenimonas sp. TaxID=1872635 RepID=UPI0025BD958E|nr:CpsB/CapC family capsule biosynthesis tyrosine phosphatase [Arenimonas sp.]